MKRTLELIIFNFLKLLKTKHLGKVFQNCLNDYIWLAERGKNYTSYF